MAAPDPTSRYAGLPEIRVVAPDGSVRVLGAPRAVPAPPTRGSYTVRRRATGSTCSRRSQPGDSTRWWLLADANPFADATRLERPGATIDLPDA